MGLTGRRAEVLVLALMLGAVTTGSSVLGNGPAGAATPPGPAVAGVAELPGRERAVTLVTGDRVIFRPGVAGRRAVDVRPAAGREWVRFLRYTDRGDVLVVPSDAMAAVTAGRVDRRLFNVTMLVRQGFDDRARKDLPLIVTRADGAAPRTLRERLSADHAQPVRDLPAVGGTAARVSKAAAGAFWAAAGSDTTRSRQGRAASQGASRIWLDGKVRATLDRSVHQMGVPAAWRTGLTGKGVKVAVLDTGIDRNHPDFAGRIAATRDFTGGAGGVRDGGGHGTHVASIVTGSGAGSRGRYRGVAPDARLLVGKVLDDDGEGEESSIIAGMQWAAESGAKVVNLSLGIDDDATLDPMELAVNRLTAATGTLFVTAAGNKGPDDRTLASPGSADAALTVGAVDRQDQIATFSSGGPRVGDDAIKPDITAPGVAIAAARAAGTHIGADIDARYTRLSGTSMATAHVTGAAAILAQQHPTWRAGQLKAALMGSAAGDRPDAYRYGAGRVDVAHAVAQSVYALPASISAGVVRWPHTDDAAIGKTVTYANDGPRPAILDLSVDVRDPSGKPAPAGMVAVNPGRVTVPPGGRVPVSVTFDTRVPGPDGLYRGVVTARGGSAGTTIRTPVAVTKEIESYDVRLTVLDRRGTRVDASGLRLVDVDRPQEFSTRREGDTNLVRLPKGRYHLDGWVATPPEGDAVEDIHVYVAEPNIVVGKDTTLVIDAREGRPVGTTVDRPTARTGQAVLDLFRQLRWSPTGTGITVFGTDLDRTYVRPSRGSAPGQFRFTVEEVKAEPDRAEGFAGSPYIYHTAWSEDGRIPRVLTRRIRNGDLALVQGRHGAPAPGKAAIRDLLGTTPTGSLPFTLTEYYTPRFPWNRTLGQFTGTGGDGEIETSMVSDAQVFTLGRPRTERWNKPVFGPAFPGDANRPPRFATREADVLSFDVPLFSDQTPSHHGYSATDTSRTTLYRDGKQVGTEATAGSGTFPVAAGPATYRLETVATRSGVANLSTRVSAAWTFRSARPAGSGPQALPLMAVRFAPDLDDHNRAPVGRFSFPVYVQQQPSTARGRPVILTVHASYDDGKTWHPAILTGSRDHRIAHLTHRTRAAFVSLKATVIDSAGNRVDQAIIRAYALRR
jgi:subtilisin family serine protease